MTEFPQPLRFAVGSHQAGSGRGCAMNVISYINGDTVITDYPDCSARPLARIVQHVNDHICTHRDGDLLCPSCSLTMYRLGVATIGTAAATDEQVWAWTAELLDSPGWGVIRFADEQGASAINAVADLARRAAHGDSPARYEWGATRAAAWDAAGDAARAALAATRGAARGAAGVAAGDAARAALAAAGVAAGVAAGGARDAAGDAARAALAATRGAAGVAAGGARDAAGVRFATDAIDAWHRIDAYARMTAR